MGGCRETPHFFSIIMVIFCKEKTNARLSYLVTFLTVNSPSWKDSLEGRSSDLSELTVTFKKYEFCNNDRHDINKQKNIGKG